MFVFGFVRPVHDAHHNITVFGVVQIVALHTPARRFAANTGAGSEKPFIGQAPTSSRSIVGSAAATAATATAVQRSMRTWLSRAAEQMREARFTTLPIAV